MRRLFLLLPVLSALVVPWAYSAESDVRIEAPVSLFDRAALIDYAPPGEAEPDKLPERYEEHRIALAGDLEDLLLAEAEAGGGSLYASENALIVAGGAEVVDLIRSRVAAIDAFIQGRSTLSVAAVHVDDVGDAGSDAAIRAALADKRARVIWSSRITSRRGEPVVRDVLDETTFVADFDVEVAQSASIADPIVQTLATGWRISLQQRALDGERAFVNLSFQLSKLASKEPVEIGVGTFDRPTVPFVSVTTPMVVRRGEPGVVFVDHPWEDGVLALVVNIVSLPAVPRLPYRLVDVAAHAGVGTLPLDLIVGSDDEGFDEEDPLPYADADALVDRIVVADAGVALTPYILALSNSQYTVPETRARRIVRRTWRGATTTSLPGYDPLDGSLTAESEAALREKPSTTWTSLFAMPGARTMMHAGTWTRAVIDYDVEIADTAVMTDPIVASFIEGDLLEINPWDVARDSDVRVTWWVARAFTPETAEIVVRRDISGERLEERVDRVDVLRHRSWNGRVVITESTPAEVRLTGDTAEIDLWSRD